MCECKCCGFNRAFDIVLEKDMENCRKFISENIDDIRYDKEKNVWLIDNVEIVDELWYEMRTSLHPKILIQYINQYLVENFEKLE